jgi:biotin carboxyl carrier protein
MGYADCLARISQLDTMMHRLDPGWVSSGTAFSDSSSVSGLAGEGLVGGSTFSGVLEGLTGTSAPTSEAPAPATASSAPAAAVPRTTSSTSSTSSTSGLSTVVSAPLSGPAISFSSPLSHARLTQAFGPTSEVIEHSATVDGVFYAHYHYGIDLAAALGSPVHAAAAGTVVAAGTQPESGGAVIVEIRHDDGYMTFYGHLDPSLQVTVGERVAAGQVIGTVGMTGHTTGPHVHFGLYTSDGTAIDPSPYLAARALPDPATLAGPSSSNPSILTKISGSAALDSFDAISSRVPYAAQIRSAAVAGGIDPMLLAALVSVESGFNAGAVSTDGAQGLTQLMPKTAASLSVTDPFDAQQNLNAGAEYLAGQLKHFGRVDLALAAYNAGPSAVSRLGAVPDSAAAYVSKILSTWSSYQEPVS